MDERAIARRGGWIGVIAGLLGAALGLLLLVVPPAVPAELFNFPFAADAFVVNQLALCAQHLLLAVALWAFWRAGLAGRGTLAMTGLVLAAGAFVGLAVWELVAIVGSGLVYPSEDTAWIDTGYGVASLVNAVGLVVLGIATIRAGMLMGAARWLVLVTGIYVFVPILPALFAGGFVLGRIVLAVWMLLFALLGVVMVRWSALGSAAPTRSSAVAA
ncbi:hypothetical protein [Agromyces seonyuensis]|uniref:DUF998 domain-containing protein n=1 Tax=Agromyces seonyuensis TaxID=2662446 RepID=A0A6I4NWP6_9MICO|nr:hypothetical protein [Agromyces seonyuensis]MWB98700.1 hypothetical protein [Agromyces seonyuensis]